MEKHQTPHRASAGLICLLLLFTTAGLQARPTTPEEAMLVVAGWLTDNAEPFDTALGNQVVDVETVTGAAGEPVYYVVHLRPSGFVIVPADDLVEPILSFTADPTYDPSAPDPLTALVTADVNRRLVDVYAAGTSGRLQIQSATDTQTRWADLIDKVATAPSDLHILGLPGIGDVRVAPLVQTHWAQDNVCSQPCYNYFTPNNNPAGCAATAMAQLMYYHRYPTAGIGQHSVTIQVLGKDQPALTRGGDGAGGPYQWTDMVLAPDCSMTAVQRQAIGALCYDAGVAVRMDYDPKGSGADGFAMVPALQDTFGYSNGISGANNGREIGAGLANMINPNLDAEYPVILGITGQTAHAVLVDGYGYDTSSRIKPLYHHLNMGWAGRDDIWYNLPSIGNYDTVLVCLYNLFPQGTGEIISGRVTDASNRPIADATIQADLRTKRYQTTTNDKGVYALTKLPSASSFTIQVDKPGFTFSKQTVETGTSRDQRAAAGNKWGINFVGTPATISAPAEENPSDSQLPSEGTAI